MTFRKFLLPAALLLCLSSCIEINEDIEVKKDGSGQWTTHMDMSQLLDLMQNYVGKEEMEKQLPNRMMDTTVYFKNLVDTSSAISEEKKALVKNGKISMKLNMDKKLFNTDMNFPFRNLDNLQTLYASLGDGSLGTGQLLKSMGGGKEEGAAGSMPGPDMSQFNNLYDFRSRDGKISRKVNQEKLKALVDNPQFSQMKDAGNMGVEIPYTITLHLPRAVKKVDNPIAKVSDDKKTVVIKYNLVEMLNNPQKFEYSIEY